MNEKSIGLLAGHSQNLSSFKCKLLLIFMLVIFTLFNIAFVWNPSYKESIFGRLDSIWMQTGDGDSDPEIIFLTKSIKNDVDLRTLNKTGDEKGTTEAPTTSAHRDLVVDEAKTVVNKCKYGPKGPKVFCAVFTHRGNHQSKAVAVANTWGRRCDKTVFITGPRMLRTTTVSTTTTTTTTTTLAASNSTASFRNDSLSSNGTNSTTLLPTTTSTTTTTTTSTSTTTTSSAASTVSATPPSIYDDEDDQLNLPFVYLNMTEDKYDKLTEKSILTFMYIYENHLEDYDWFYKADDDTYVIVDNLKYFLANKCPDENSTYGRHFHYFSKWGYLSGGSGYTLNRETIRKFGDQMKKNASFCMADSKYEDVDIAACLHKVQVYPGDSRDKQGRERFHPEGLESLWREKVGWVVSYSKNEVQIGRNCCSDTSIGFHRVSGYQMNYLDYLIYNLKPQNFTFNHDDISFYNPPNV